MSALKLRLTLMFATEPDRLVLNLCSPGTTGFIDEEAFDQLTQMLEKKSAKFTKTEALDSLIKQAKRLSTWDSELKFLMVFHKLTHRQSGAYSDLLNGDQLETLAKFEVVKTSLKTFVHTAMVPHYYKYLQKLNYNYDDLGVCFFSNDQFAQRLKENELSLLHFVSKVQNTLKYLIELLPFIEVSLTQFKMTDVVKQVAYFCLTDCYHYYTYINHAVSHLIGEIFGLKEHEAFFLYELYCEHIQITRRLTSLFLLKNYLTVFMIRAPEFFEINHELNRKVEFYMNSLKGGMQRSSPKTKLAASKLEVKIGSTEDSDHATRPGLTLQELSYSLAQVTSPNFRPSYRVELFKPPIMGRSNSQTTSPKIRVTSPTGQVQEGKALFISPKTRSSVRIFQELNPFALKANMKIGIGQAFAGDNAARGLYKQVDLTTPNRSPEDSMFDSSLAFKNSRI